MAICDLYWLLDFMKTNSHFRRSFIVAFPCGIIAAIFEVGQNHWFPDMFAEAGLLIGSDSYSMLTFLVGFTVIFRTQNAYGRYWEGVETIFQISGDFYDAASSLMAMCSKEDSKKESVHAFKHKVIRLLSLLNALIYDELEDVSESRMGYSYAMSELPLIDAIGIDETTLTALDRVDEKVEATFQWIQLLVVDNMRSGVLDVPAPILTRVFQEMGAGMLKFHGALKLAHVPFPLPYSATTIILLCMHWLISPLAICSSVTSSAWAFVLTFVPVFTIWALNGIAGELENPFSRNCSGVFLGPKHARQNKRLISLLKKDLTRLPELSARANLDEEHLLEFSALRLSRIGDRSSLNKAIFYAKSSSALNLDGFDSEEPRASSSHGSGLQSMSGGSNAAALESILDRSPKYKWVNSSGGEPAVSSFAEYRDSSYSDVASERQPQRESKDFGGLRGTDHLTTSTREIKSAQANHEDTAPVVLTNFPHERQARGSGVRWQSDNSIRLTQVSVTENVREDVFFAHTTVDPTADATMKI